MELLEKEILKKNKIYKENKKTFKSTTNINKIETRLRVY